MKFSTGKHETVAWCVPSAIHMLTGIPLDTAHSRAAFIQDIAYPDVEGVYISEAILILSDLGYNAEPINVYDRYSDRFPMGPTISRFISEMKPFEKINKVLIELDEHVIVSHMGYVGDNWTKKMVTLDNFPKTKRHVKAAYIISEKM